MGILLDGFRKQKRYTTNANGDHQLVSTWTHSDTVIMPDGTPLSEAVLGDGNDAVKQTETVNDNDNYEILLSQTADDVTKIEGARKSSKLKFNPYSSSLMMTTRNGQSTLTPNQLTISGVGGEGSLTNNTLVLSNNGISTTYSNSDIVTDNHNTWDGTNTSLKTAVTNAKGTVTQTETTTSGNYELLFSGTGDDTTRTEGAKKSTYLKFNPTNKSLNIVNEYNDTNYKSVAVSPTGVNVLSAENGVHNLRYGADDIVFNAPSNPPTWDGTNTSLKAAIAAAASTGGGGVAVPPVIFDNGNLKKVNDVDGFPGLEKVFLTPTSYEALTQTEKEDLGKIYYVSEYDYYSDKGGTLVLRVKNDEIKLFVNGFVDENTQLEDGNFVGVINDKIRELIGSYFIGSIAYDENKEPIGGSLPYVYIDANYSRIAFRNASGDSSRVINTITYAVIDLTNYSQGQGSVLQSNPWEDPYDISGGMTIYYGDKQYSNFNMPDINSVQVPPVIFDNGKLMKISDMTGFPELEKVFVASEEYSQLTTAQKQDLSKIYYVSPYKFYSFEDGKIIIRTNDNETKWYFNGFEVPSDGTYNVPSEMSSYFAANQASNAYSDETSETDLGYIELGLNVGVNVIYFQQGLWGGSWIAAGTPVWGVVSKNGGDNQQNTYSDPYDTETPVLIYYGGKQYTEYEPAKPYVELTQSEYDALPSSKTSDGIIYFING